MNPYVPQSELAARRDRLAERLEEHRIDALFLPPSSDLEYLTGLERDLPSFGQSAYAHGWVTGAFIVPGREPLYVLPRMFVAFHLWGEEPENLVTVNESDDGSAAFGGALASLGDVATIGIGARTWGETVLELGTALPSARLVNGTPIVNELRRVKSDLEIDLMTKAALIADDAMAATTSKVEPGVTMADLAEEVEHQLRIRGSRTPSFPTHIFSHGYTQSHDSTMESGLEPIAEGEAVMFDFGAVWGGYCSDFGRTIVCGEPHPEYERVYGIMLAAQEAGRAAAVPGALASEVNAACRAPIEEAGLGAFFRHRMGHGIGLDVHEAPFISEEDRTPLEAGMTFTDEPSILWDEHFAVRIEDVVVCADGGGRVLNELPGDAVIRRPGDAAARR
jgi:Xaa-Pro aminopeptidase